MKTVMKMIQTVNKQSNKYSNIQYNFIANSFIPESGYLNHLLLKYSASITASLLIKEKLLNDYRYASVMLVYKQVKSKASRKKAPENMLFRENLNNDILDYLKVAETTPFTETKILLLNDTVLDKSVGDSGLQCLFVFEKHDGSHEFVLSPGAGIRALTNMIGMGIFECENVDEVLDSLIMELSDLCLTHIIPPSGITLTSKLTEDIKRYLEFYLYGK